MLGATRFSKSLSRSAKPGGGSIPLAPSKKINADFKIFTDSLMEKHITVGIAGHVDHGKTSLVRALTGIDTDRLEEEKRRGLSIESGIAPFELESGKQIALVDVPGHTDFLKNTIRGLSSVDMALLVVAADDGIMPQTLEHIQILEFFNAKDGFVVLSKVDLMDDEGLELAELEISETLENSFLEGKQVIPFSVLDRQGLGEIRRNIEEIARKIPGKRLEVPFRLWIDQVKGFSGYGTVVSGTILSGKLRQDDPLHLLPSGIETRGRSLETHHKNAAEAFAGQRVGINLHKVPLKDVQRGMVLAEPGTVKATYLLNMDLQVLPGATKPIKNRQRVKLYLGTSVTNTLVILMDREQLEPGESGLAQLRLMKPIGALPGDPFVVCPLNIQTTIAGGKILEIPHQKYRKGKASMMILYLNALQDNNLKDYMKHALKSNPNHLVKTSELARNTGFSVKEIDTGIKEMAWNGEVLSFKGSGFFGKEQYQELKDGVHEAVEKILKQDPLKTNVKADEIRFQVAPSLDDLPFQRMLAELCNEGKLLKMDGGFRSQNHSVDLPLEKKRIVSLILDYALQSGFRPFSADTIWKLHNKKYDKKEIIKLVGYLSNQKILVRLNDGRFLSTDHVERIKERVKAVILKKGIFRLPDIPETLGYGRLIGVTVLEYLDSIGFTQRLENGRVLKEIHLTIKEDKDERSIQKHVGNTGAGPGGP